MKKTRLKNLILALILCFCTIFTFACAGGDSGDGPPGPGTMPPGSELPDDGGDGEKDPTKPNVPSIDDMFEGIKMITAGSDIEIQDPVIGKKISFNEALDRQITIFATDLLTRFASVYGNGATLDGNAYVELDKNLDESYQYNGQAIIKANGFLDAKTENPGMHRLNSAEDYNYQFISGITPASWSTTSGFSPLLNFNNVINGGFDSRHISADEGFSRETTVNASKAWKWNYSNANATTASYVAGYKTTYLKKFRYALAEILAMGESKTYETDFNDTTKYNNLLNKIDHLGFLSNDEENIRNFVFSEIIGESVVIEDSANKPRLHTGQDVAGNLSLSTVNGEYVYHYTKTIDNKSYNQKYSLFFDASAKTYKFYNISWTGYRELLSSGTFTQDIILTLTETGTGKQTTGTTSAGGNTDAVTPYQNSAITINLNGVQLNGSNCYYWGNGRVDGGLNTGFESEKKYLADNSLTILPKSAINSQRNYKAIGLLTNAMLDMAFTSVFQTADSNATITFPRSALDANKNKYENEGKSYITLYPKIPRAETSDTTWGEMAAAGGNATNPDLLFTPYQEFKSVIYKPKMSGLVIPELWLALSAEQNMRITMQINFKYVANGVVLYNDVLGSERNTTNKNDKTTFIIERDYHLVPLPAGSGDKDNPPAYTGPDLPDHLKPDPNNRDYFFDFSLYEIIDNLENHKMNPYNGKAEEETTLWDHNFTIQPNTQGAGSTAGYEAGDNYVEISFIIVKAERMQGSNYIESTDPVLLSVGFADPMF